MKTTFFLAIFLLLTDFILAQDGANSTAVPITRDIKETTLNTKIPNNISTIPQSIITILATRQDDLNVTNNFGTTNLMHPFLEKNASRSINESGISTTKTKELQTSSTDNYRIIPQSTIIIIVSSNITSSTLLSSSPSTVTDFTTAENFENKTDEIEPLSNSATTTSSVEVTTVQSTTDQSLNDSNTTILSSTTLPEVTNLTSDITITKTVSTRSEETEHTTISTTLSSRGSNATTEKSYSASTANTDSPENTTLVSTLLVSSTTSDNVTTTENNNTSEPVAGAVHYSTSFTIALPIFISIRFII